MGLPQVFERKVARFWLPFTCAYLLRGFPPFCRFRWRPRGKHQHRFWGPEFPTLSRAIDPNGLHPTVDGQNPAPLLKPWETIVCWYSQGNHHSRVSCVVQDGSTKPRLFCAWTTRLWRCPFPTPPLAKRGEAPFGL